MGFIRFIFNRWALLLCFVFQLFFLIAALVYRREPLLSHGTIGICLGRLVQFKIALRHISPGSVLLLSVKLCFFTILSMYISYGDQCLQCYTVNIHHDTVGPWQGIPIKSHKFQTRYQIKRQSLSNRVK